jgi:hypothetical protein
MAKEPLHQCTELAQNASPEMKRHHLYYWSCHLLAGNQMMGLLIPLKELV